MNKAEIKREYKALVRQGRDVEANKVLNQIRLGIAKVNTSKKVIVEAKPIKKKEESLNSLKKIKGIGHKTIKDIKCICNTIEDLRKMIEEDKLPLRDDIVIKLKNHLENKYGSY